MAATGPNARPRRTVAMAASILVVTVAAAAVLWAFRQAEIERRVAMALGAELNEAGGAMDESTDVWGDVGAGSTRVLIVGDSRVERWSPLPEAPAATVRACGAGGETVSGLAARLPATLARTDPDVVVIVSGINDLVAASLAPARAPELLRHLESELDAIVRDIQDAGSKVILTSIIRPAVPGLRRRILFWSDGIHPMVAEANAALRDLSARHDVSFIDFDAILADEPHTPLPAHLAVDALHLNDAAYRRLNEHIVAGLAR